MIEIICYTAAGLIIVVGMLIIFAIFHAGVNNKMVFPMLNNPPPPPPHFYKFYDEKIIEGEVIKEND